MKKTDFTGIIVLLILALNLSILYTIQFNHSKESNVISRREHFLRTAAEFEYLETSGVIENATSIKIELPDLNSNITEIELNFTNICQHRQIRTIEGNISESFYRQLYKNSNYVYRVSYGQEFFFPEYTELYGIYFYGFKSVISPEEILRVFVTGFDDNTHIYNETIYYNQTINISNNLDWYFQNFSHSPRYFYADSYYFAIDGRPYVYEEPEDVPTYFFACNEINPKYPSLWWGERNYYGFNPYQGDPFMLKTLEKINRTYIPEEIEMRVLIDGNYYNLTNGVKGGDGNLLLTHLNFKPEEKIFNFPIESNLSEVQLIYNISFKIKLQKLSEPNIITDNNSNNENLTILTGISPEFFVLIIAIIILSFLGVLMSHLAIKRKKINNEIYRKKMFNRYMDVLNLDYIIISNKTSGLNIYEQVITDKKISPALVGGFLQAIRTFGIELAGVNGQSQTIKLEYQNSMILMSEYRNYRIINIFEDNPSEEFSNALEPLSRDIDKIYGQNLEKFDGEISQFKGIRDLLEKHLFTPLAYPLRIVNSDCVKLNKYEQSIVNRASINMKKRKSSFFYISHLITELDFDPKKAETILNLIKKKVFQPIH